MKNIMKSIWYEILHSKMMIRIYILFMVIMGLFAVLNVGDSVQKGSCQRNGSRKSITYIRIPDIYVIDNSRNNLWRRL